MLILKSIPGVAAELSRTCVVPNTPGGAAQHEKLMQDQSEDHVRLFLQDTSNEPRVTEITDKESEAA